MSQAFSLTENILESLYHTSDALPPLWAVIYQEGIRRHHLLFPEDRVNAWTDGSGLMEEGWDELDSERLAESVMGILCCQRLTEMQALIRTLDAQTMRICFFLYLNALAWWQGHLRGSLLH